ncbi:MAG: DUF357 domain-containing protein [Candidatus Altiarchaeota archaeon]
MSDAGVKERLDFYLSKAKPLFEGVEVCVPKEQKLDKLSKEFEEMAFGYYKDAKHFKEKGEHLQALLSLEYAEGWLDAGKRLGVFKEKRS